MPPLLNTLVEGLIERGNEAVFLLDESYQILFANTLAANLTGYPAEALKGTFFPDLVEPADRNLLADILGAQPQGPSLRFQTELKVLTEKGDRKTVEACLSFDQSQDHKKRIYAFLRDITRRKDMESRLLETHRAMEKIIELGNDGILVFDETYRIEFANQMATEITGYDKEGLLGLDFRRLLTPEDQSFLVDLPHQMRLKVDENRKVCTQFKIFCADGSPREVEICLTMASIDNRLKIYAYLRDLSERIRIENEIRQANEFLTNIIRSSVDGIIAADMQGNIIIFNEGAESMMGYSAREVIGRIHITRVYPEGMAKEIMKKLRSPKFGGVGKLQTIQVTLVGRDGEAFPANLSAALVYDKQGHELASVGIFTDLRERIKMQKKLEETHLQLLHSEKMASLGKLAAGVAHEINNPLGGILIYASMMLEETPKEDERRKDLQQIVEQTLRCKEIVKELLEFSRQAKDRQALIDLNRTLNQALSILEHQAMFHNIQVVRDFDPDLPQLPGDSGQLSQVFINLIVNAADAMKEKGVLTLKTQYAPDKNQAVIEIQDTGCGIPEENLPRIFDPFFTTKEVGKGTGLGLSTAYGIIKQHQGEIQVESTMGTGTTFRIRLPAESFAESAGPEAGIR
jgi:PAS domain S-box-containing protein